MINIYWRFERKFRRLAGLPEIPQYKIHKYLKHHQPLEFKGTDFSLSVIIPCFKHDRFIKQCFNSLKRQTRKPDEIIFINDNSPDNTEKIIKQIIDDNKDLKIALINNKNNEGQAESINIGVGVAESSYVMILNDDDYLFNDAIEKILSGFKNNPDLVLLGAPSISFSGESEPADVKSDNNVIFVHNPEQVGSYKNYNDLNMTHSSMTFVKYAYKSIGKYNKNKKDRLVPFSDRDFQLWAALLYPVGVFSDSLVYWRDDSSVDSGLNS